MNYETISIRDVIRMINNKEMYLPEIQRGFVWKEKQVEKLFESVFVGYPIGTLLFWKTTKKDLPQDEHGMIKDCKHVYLDNDLIDKIDDLLSEVNYLLD